MKVQTDKTQESLKNLQTNNESPAQQTERLKKAKAAAEFKAQNNTRSSTSTNSQQDVKTEISPKAVEFAKASELAKAAPDVREGKVADLKARIQSGQYQVNAETLADKIFEEHLKTNGIGN